MKQAQKKVQLQVLRVWSILEQRENRRLNAWQVLRAQARKGFGERVRPSSHRQRMATSAEADGGEDKVRQNNYTRFQGQKLRPVGPARTGGHA